jgi:hypothetical protein
VINNLVIKNSRSQTVTPISPIISSRANLDSDAKRLDFNKLVVTAVSQAFAEATSACDEIDLFFDSESELTEDLGIHFGRSIPVRHSASEFSALATALAKPKAALCIGLFGSSRVRKNQTLAALAKALGRFDIGAQKKLLIEITDTYKTGDLKTRMRQRPDHRELVVQEKPGKYSALDVLGPTLKANLKTLRNAATGSAIEAKRPLCVPDGWGVFCFCVRTGLSSGLADSGSVGVAIAELNIEKYQLHFEVPALIVDLALDWFFLVSGADISNTKGIEILCPYVAVATAFKEALIRKIGEADADRLLSHEHLLLGWNPLNSVLDSITSCTGPTLIIEFSSFPQINLVAIWK